VGALLVALAALLWATDALFRVPALATLDPAVIVLCEHAIGLLLLTPVALARRGAAALAVDARGNAGRLAAVGVGGSALATLAFTAAFQRANPSVVILLQKLQPVLVIVGARAFLGERPAPGFYPWAALAMAASAVLSIPELRLDAGGAGAAGPLLAIGAAALWAASTLFGKALIARVPPLSMTLWRYAFGLLGMAAVVGALGARIPLEELARAETAGALFYMSLFPGLVALVIYYHGLARTPASVATLAELAFPVGAVALNTLYLNMPLRPVQAVAGAALLAAVTRISRLG
jgi:drug/metabolite transporter, DME family